MTSIQGRSRTFDARADGYARGEACGSAVARCTRTALELLGCAVRQDGRSASLTAPNGLAQQGVLRAALKDASLSANALEFYEAHGTGTMLGDPIETGSLSAAVLSECEKPLVVMGGKANFGHAEPAAGMMGLLKLAAGLSSAFGAPNAQLRTFNPFLSSSDKTTGCFTSQMTASQAFATGGVSSFGYSGTISHAVLCRSEDVCRHSEPCVYRRHTFKWAQAAHPFLQSTRHASSAACHFYSSVSTLLPFVSGHVVQNRVIFPGAGYLEMARAAANATLQQEASVHAVYFLQPLAIELPSLQVDVVVDSDRIEVRSCQEMDCTGLHDMTVHCSGRMAASTCLGHALNTASKRSLLSIDACVGQLYDGFNSLMVQYGPSYRTLVQLWHGHHMIGEAAARLKTRRMKHNMHVHPADLDDALCVGVTISEAGQGTKARVPFAVDHAVLQCTATSLWAVC